jgi:hypothetical protein
VLKVEVYRMNRKKVNQIKSKKLFLGMNKSVNGKNCTAKMKTLGILGTSNSRH